MSVPPVRVIAGLPSQHGDVPGDVEWQQSQIGIGLETLQSDLLRSVQTLREVLPQQLASYLDETPNLLQRLNCKIAVIGQVKAGKSSFINAFTQQPDLLPTHVNPWTTAVTHLHFGCSPPKPSMAANFSFFEAGEWDALVNGGGLVRDLTARFVPGFEVDILEQHVSAMRRRSEMRLGPTLKTLLGTNHEFESLGAETLAEYVCAGTVGGSTVEERVGRYSDIVKKADLYFPDRVFSFPTVIIDTPGTNDPFLVRDEITRRSLDSADIHIVVLTARQALSAADVALLRILHGLNKDRVVVFINRIDELSNIGSDIPEIIRDVRQRLEREFPHNAIQIIAGSALWAQAAFKRQSFDGSNVLGLKLMAYAAARGMKISADGERSTALDGQQVASLMMRCSGMFELNRALAELMPRTHASYVLRQVAGMLQELAQIGQPALQQEIIGLESEGVIENHNEGDPSRLADVDAQLAEIEAEVRQNDRSMLVLHSLQVDAQARTTQIIEDQHAQIRDVLSEAVELFAARECEALGEVIGQNGHQRVWTSRPADLRRVLEMTFGRAVHKAEAQLNALEDHVVPWLQGVLKDLRPDLAAWERPDKRGVMQPLPIGALRRTIALDLGEPWWARWWHGSRSREQRVEQLRTLIVSEFEPIVEDLAGSARTRLLSRRSELIESITMMSISLMEILQQQSEARRARLLVLIDEREEAQVNERVRLRAERLALLRGHVATLQRIGQRLNLAFA